MISNTERTVASFGIGFIISLLVAIILFAFDENLKAGYYCLPFGLIAAILFEKYDNSEDNKQKYKNYLFGFIGGILPSIVAGF